jgi:hypothetical protein
VQDRTQCAAPLLELADVVLELVDVDVELVDVELLEVVELLDVDPPEPELLDELVGAEPPAPPVPALPQAAARAAASIGTKPTKNRRLSIR